MRFMEYDSPIMCGIGKVMDILWLSTLWFLCCLPVVTIGASTTALYYTSVKAIRGYVVCSFVYILPACCRNIVFLRFYGKSADTLHAGNGKMWMVCRKIKK